MEERAFEQMWLQNGDFEFSSAEEETLCIYAQNFGGWANVLYNEEVHHPTLIGVNQKILMLVKKYFEWRTVVPKSHRDLIGERSHTCIFHILERFFYRLKALELGLSPPMLFLPEPSQPSRPSHTIKEVSGIYLGEIVGDND